MACPRTADRTFTIYHPVGKRPEMDDTRAQLLSEAESLIRTRGYAAFSYADLAEKVGIRKASIHHHFPTKEILGATLIDEYLARFEKDLHGIFADENNV